MRTPLFSFSLFCDASFHTLLVSHSFGLVLFSRKRALRVVMFESLLSCGTGARRGERKGRAGAGYFIIERQGGKKSIGKEEKEP